MRTMKRLAKNLYLVVKILPLILILLSMSMVNYVNAGEGEESACDYQPEVAELLVQTEINRWLDWVEKLSGAEPAPLSGFPVLIQSRRTAAMFRGEANARAYDYVLLQAHNWYPEAQIEEHAYPFSDLTAKNLILTIPGQTSPEEVVLLTAHLDDTAWNSTIAPGANDNGVGSATVLEAARLLRQFRFERTIKLILFTGEESGLVGSRAYVARYPYLDYRGVVNMDMFGWDGDGDRCFEIHAGTLPTSQETGLCFADSISSYDLNLSYDFITTGATGASDHYPFWQQGIGAIGVIENTYDNGLPDGCDGADRNPYYHRAQDTIELNVTPPYAFDIARAGMGTIAALAKPIGACFSEEPKIKSVVSSGAVSLSWEKVPKAESYRVHRSSFGYDEGWEAIAETSELEWVDHHIREGWPYQYQIEAVTGDGMCVSKPSNCVSIGPPPPPNFSFMYLPNLNLSETGN